jgi:DNA-binding transcriptional ArsR family regulator
METIVNCPRQPYHRLVAVRNDGDSAMATLFGTLADDTRLAIVRRLAQGEARVVDLTAEVGRAQSTVSNHLAHLRRCGLVDLRADGGQSFYAIVRPELTVLFAAAELVIAAAKRP